MIPKDMPQVPQTPPEMSPMARKLARITAFSKGADIEKIVAERISNHQMQLDEETATFFEALQQKYQQVQQVIQLAGEEIDALKPKDVFKDADGFVKDSMADSAALIQKAKGVQEALFIAMNQGEEKLQREWDDRSYLNAKILNYQYQMETYNPHAGLQNSMVHAGEKLNFHIANIHDPRR